MTEYDRQVEATVAASDPEWAHVHAVLAVAAALADVAYALRGVPEWRAPVQ